jgi:hypothetical protein
MSLQAHLPWRRPGRSRPGAGGAGTGFLIRETRAGSATRWSQFWHLGARDADRGAVVRGDRRVSCWRAAERRTGWGFPDAVPDLVTIWRVLTAVGPAVLDCAIRKWKAPNSDCVRSHDYTPDKPNRAEACRLKRRPDLPDAQGRYRGASARPRPASSTLRPVQLPVTAARRYPPHLPPTGDAAGPTGPRVSRISRLVKLKC